MKKRGQFCLAKMNRDGVHGEEWYAYRRRFELGLVISLALAMSLFVVSKRLDQGREVPVYIVGDDFSALDLPPVTKSGGRPKVPTLPSVPIASEDESIPEEETIELTELDLSVGIVSLEGLGFDDFGSVGGGSTGPRPLRETVPEYPDELKRKGVEGTVLLSILVNARGRVDSVYVLENSSGSRRLEKAAVEAAKLSLYMPSRQGDDRRSIWIQRPYVFEGK